MKECNTNKILINPVVAQNIEFRRVEEGEVILRMVKLAQERNINYTPSHEAAQAMYGYCLRKNIPPPGGMPNQPQYAPQPSPVVVPEGTTAIIINNPD